MTQRIASIQKLIAAKLQQTNPSPGWRDSLAVTPAGDLVDTTQQAVDRDMASRDLNRTAAMARQLRAALDRIADGTYGACTQCGQPIPSKRLAAVPWAPLCLSCQEQTERPRRLDHAA